MKGRIKSKNEIEKFKESRKGYKHSEETKRKIKCSMTADAKNAISKAAKRRQHKTGNDASCKRKCNIEGEEFCTLLEGAKYAKVKLTFRIAP